MSFPILSWRRIIVDNKETPYIISSKGIIMNDATGEFMLVLPDKENYPTVKLFIDGEERTLKVHRLCCEAFNENPFNLPEVDHIYRDHWDADKDHLEFVTGEENHRRLLKSMEIEKKELCNYSSGEKHYSNHYSDLQIFQVCLRLLKQERVISISEKTDVDVRSIYLIKAGKIYKHISCYFSFNNDGFFTKNTIKNIHEYTDQGLTADEIAERLELKYPEYFIDCITTIQNIYKNVGTFND